MSSPRTALTVVQILPALDEGGVERGTIEIARALVERGHRAVVISRGGRLLSVLAELGAEHVAMPIGAKSISTLMLVGRLRRVLRDLDADIVHLRSRLPAWIGWLAWRGMDPATRPRLVTTVHGLHSVNWYSRIMTRGERVIAVSDTVRNYVETAYPGTDMSRVVTIPRGVDDEAYPRGFTPDAHWLASWRKSQPQLAGKQVLTLPGRITRLKGHRDFIELLGRLHRSGRAVHGLVVGPQDPRRAGYAREIRALAAELPITFLGGRDDLREILAVSDLVLSLSRQPESFGRTTLEALCLGVPVVGYDHGGVGEILAAMYPEGAVATRDGGALAVRCARLLDSRIPVTRSNAFPLHRMIEETMATYAALAQETR